MIKNKYKLSYTASDINKKLGLVNQLQEDIENLEIEIENLANSGNTGGTIDNGLVGEDTSGLLTTVANHISDKQNPHNVTASQIGAALSEHTHDISDINGLDNIGLGNGDMESSVYDPKGYRRDIFTYVDNQVNSIAMPDIDASIEMHDSSTTAHRDIRNAIPTKTSELTNDSGFLTNYTETDPTVPSWAKQSTKPTYTASEIGAAESFHTHNASDINGLDEITNVYSKESVLSDATKSLYGLNNNAVPNDVFGWIGKYNQHWWNKRSNSGHWELAKSTTSKTLIHDHWVQTDLIQISVLYSDSISLNESNGEICMVSPTELIISYGDSASILSTIDVLKGKYFAVNGWIDLEDPENGVHCTYTSEDLSNNSLFAFDFVYHAESDATTYCEVDENVNDDDETDIGLYLYIYIDARKIDSQYISDDNIGEWELIYSNERSAYPDYGFVDGFEYVYIGVPFDNLLNKIPKMELISYEGTGTSGKDNPVSITASFVPDIWIMLSMQNNNDEDKTVASLIGKTYTICFTKDLSTLYTHDDPENNLQDGNYGFGCGSSNTRYSKISDDRKTLNWYTTDASPEKQFNLQGYTYTVLVIKF